MILGIRLAILLAVLAGELERLFARRYFADQSDS
jgi:hypothetical protein